MKTLNAYMLLSLSLGSLVTSLYPMLVETPVAQMGPGMKVEQENKLIDAINVKDRTLVESLIQQGVDVNQADQDGYPAIVYLSVWAMSDEMRPHVLPVLEKLLDAGALPDKTGDYGDTALMWFAQDGCAAAVKLLLGRGANPNSHNHIEQGPLSYASHNNRGEITEVIKALLDAGADIDHKSGADENSPLLEAISYHGFMGMDMVPVVTLLLERGAATDLKNKEGKIARQVMNDVRCYGVALPAGDPLRVIVNQYAFKNKKNK